MSSSLSTAEFTSALQSCGVTKAVGVPCRQLNGTWSWFDRRDQLVSAASEGAALAIAAGWEMAGVTGVVLAQNSGLGNMINPLTSLVLPYRLPVLVVMTLRGWPDPSADEPQHAVMGPATVPLLETLDIPHEILQPGRLREAFDNALTAREKGLPFFLLTPMGVLEDRQGNELLVHSDDELTRSVVVSTLMNKLTDDLLISTTGYLSRQAHHEGDRPENFYMQGSMGHACALGLGLASACPERRVVILDGDGAVLMHLGTASTIGASSAQNLVHVVVDNGCYESTGCQTTTSASLDWSSVAQGLGYKTFIGCDSRGALSESLSQALLSQGPVLCALKVVPTPGEVHGRATNSITPAEMAERFRSAMIE